MKYVFIIFILFSILACQKNKNNALEVLKIDDVDNIPFLMNHMRLDSVFEIITYGKYGTENKGDTINKFTLIEENIVRQKMKSFMCCHYTFTYDSLGFLREKSKFSDYLTEYSINYQRDKNQITATENDNFGNTVISLSKIEDERLVLTATKRSLDTNYVDKIKFYYNLEGELIRRVREAKSHLEGEFDDLKFVKIYSWDKEVLSETNEKQYFSNGIDYYETITIFDYTGFPISKSIQKNKDTIAKIRVAKF